MVTALPCPPGTPRAMSMKPHRSNVQSSLWRGFARPYFHGGQACSRAWGAKGTRSHCTLSPTFHDVSLGRAYTSPCSVCSVARCLCASIATTVATTPVDSGVLLLLWAVPTVAKPLMSIPVRRTVETNCRTMGSSFSRWAAQEACACAASGTGHRPRAPACLVAIVSIGCYPQEVSLVACTLSKEREQHLVHVRRTA